MTPRLMKQFYPWADGIVVVSDGVRNDLSDLTGIPYDRISVIYNPSVVKEEVQAKAKTTLDHPWFEANQPPVLVAVGRLQIQKDYPTLLRAFAQVRRSRAVKLVILGEGRERSKLEGILRELDLEQDESQPGFVENPYPFMAKASLFILSSRWEGLPTVLIEALCCGTPAVSTDCPSGPREILKDGRYGKLVPVGDSDSLAQAIEETLDGNATKPPPESWSPYELQSVVSRYASLFAAS